MFFHTFAAPNAASHRVPSSFCNALISPWSPLFHTLPSPKRSPTGTMFSHFPADPALPIYTTRGSLAATSSNENWLDADSLRCKKQMGVSVRNPLCDDWSSVIVTWRPEMWYIQEFWWWQRHYITMDICTLWLVVVVTKRTEQIGRQTDRQTDKQAGLRDSV